jgi:hypothetical protein
VAVVEIELLPEFFGRVPVDPLDAVLDRIWRATVACQGIGGFFRGHGRHGDDTADWAITAHKLAPVMHTVRSGEL